MPELDWNDPSTYPLKQLPCPDAWPTNGPPWLFEDSTPEEIAAMQQGARDEAAKATRERQSAGIVTQTPTEIDQVDPERSERIPNGFRATSKESVTASTQPKRGDVILFPLTVLSGPNDQCQYDLEFFDEWLRHSIELRSSIPNDAQIIIDDSGLNDEDDSE